MQDRTFNAKWTRRDVLKTGLITAGSAFAIGSFPRLARGASANPKVVTAVMQQALRSLDPILTTAYILRNYGYMVYDTLLALDADGKVQPQMVDRWKVSEDGKTYTFILRDQLKWTDGQPVKPEDCIASIDRWSQVDKMGQAMRGLMDEMKVVDGRSFALHFKVKTSLALRALAKPSGLPAFMMPERVAKTPISVAITETVGSGPFKFINDEYQPGIRAVFRKNENYVPRPEPASGLAGGKHVHVEEVRWLAMPDTMTTVNALRNDEIDFIEITAYDFIPILEKDPNIELIVSHQQDQAPSARFNFLYPPFDNKKVRHAAMTAISQKELLQALIGNPKYYSECFSVYGCGTPYSNDAGSEGWGRGDTDAAKKLLDASGYDGTPVVLLYPTDNPIVTPGVPAVRAALQKAGFKVDMQSMDWQTLLNRRASTKPPAEGGWNMFNSGFGVADIMDPLSSTPLAANGKGAWVGWPDVPEVESLRSQFAQSDDPAQLRDLAAQIQKLALDEGVTVPLGQDSLVMAARKPLTGVLRTYVPVMWNLKKA